MNNQTTRLIITPNHQWQLGDRIGEGGFAQVYRARAEGHERAVVKLIPKLPGSEREVLFEHPTDVPNIMPVIDSGQWDSFWVLVMPEADQSLREYLDDQGGRLTVDDAVATLIDVVEALVAIQDRVVHRDLKPENVLRLNGHWHLADFGIAKYAEATTAANTMKGAKTPPYAAPEVWRDETATSATDVYALGVMAYELLTGRLPFPGPEFRRQHIEDAVESISGIPLKLSSLVEECLYKSSQARPLPQNLLERLRTSRAEASPAALQLQAVNASVVQQIAEQRRMESVARAEAERRHELYQVAEQSLARILDSLRRQIEDNAPAVQFMDDPAGKRWHLDRGALEIGNIRQHLTPIDGIPFDVIASTQIFVYQPVSADGYVGRGHSLWYCDSQEPQAFRWYETAFFAVDQRHIQGLQPFSANPNSPPTVAALKQVQQPIQIARPFTAIDQGDEDVFIERWIGWFAQAARGGLLYPRGMPESDPQGSWRQSP